jgi:hypothetical protein
MHEKYLALVVLFLVGVLLASMLFPSGRRRTEFYDVECKPTLPAGPGISVEANTGKISQKFIGLRLSATGPNQTDIPINVRTKILVYRKVETDTHNGWSTTDNSYKIPITGYYMATAGWRGNGSLGKGDGAYYIVITKNGESFASQYTTQFFTSIGVETTGLVYANEGDKIEFNAFAGVAGTTQTYTILTDQPAQVRASITFVGA